MVVQLPIAKLGSLFIKTLAKPMAKRVKHTFKQSQLTQNILISVGQTSHVITTRMTIWSAGYKVRSIQALDNEKALSQGADFIGEAFIFGVGGGIVIWEYNKSKEKENKKEALAKQEEARKEAIVVNLVEKTTALEVNQQRLLQALERIQMDDKPIVKRRSAWFL
mmetsp:Transcript_6577/g.9612  ORF Transcript_6577/g.9612 Transcript_6577/m.9612 type:complete len:165 (+) Transcript_6577:84-578(+)